MEKLRLTDGTEMEISEGSDLRNITTEIKSYAELDRLAGKLTRENLTKVQFFTEEMLTGEYRDMELCTPDFTVMKKGGSLLAGFGLQEVPEAEKQKEEVHMALSYLTDEEAATVSSLYPEWEPETRYQTGERVTYREMLYRAKQDHTSEGQYPPDTVPALWDMISLVE
nr:carbohydrate-binding protein [Blautia caecimuris]